MPSHLEHSCHRDFGKEASDNGTLSRGLKMELKFIAFFGFHPLKNRGSAAAALPLIAPLALARPPKRPLF